MREACGRIAILKYVQLKLRSRKNTYIAGFDDLDPYLDDPRRDCALFMRGRFVARDSRCTGFADAKPSV